MPDIKKNELQPHLNEYWCIPPEQNAEFVANMEDVLDVYSLPYNSEIPVICQDEQPVQLIKETRIPIPMQQGSVEKVDFEYERNGTANIFMTIEPLAGIRHVSVRETKTAIDWAEEMQYILNRLYPNNNKVILVCDNYATHTKASFYKAFPPEEARRLSKKLDIHYTPKHGSWLDIAECELSVLTRQCLNRRIPDIENLKRETMKWEEIRNEKFKTVDWHFTKEDARTKLKRLYPQYLEK
jgi:hypothetical protein